jgi:WD40 repeat protein
MISSPVSLARIVPSTVFLLLVFALVPSTQADPSAWPPLNPIPRLEAGMHTAPIWRLSIDDQERFLITASKDKTARVWDLASGELKLLKILRVPLGGHPYEGQLFSVAISPNGEKVAVAGYTGKKVPYKKTGNFHIYIFDRASGDLEKTISDLPIDISHLTFSRDGQYLAASLMGRWGLRVYRS